MTEGGAMARIEREWQADHEGSALASELHRIMVISHRQAKGFIDCQCVTVNGEVYASSSGPGWITAVLTLAAVVLMFVGGANEFFTASKAYRSQLR